MSGGAASRPAPEGARGRRPCARGAVLGALLGWLVTLALLALALEGIARLCGLRPVVTINEPHATLGWTKRRDDSTRKSTSEYDVTFEINSLGLRDDADLTRGKPPGTRRVLFVGDSFVLGYTVDREDHFVDLVERALAADERKVQVLNGGTEGYSTDQEVLWLEEEGLSFEPDLVVLCFFQNDVFWNSQDRYTNLRKPRLRADGTLEPPSGKPPPPRSWLVRHSAIAGPIDTFALSARHEAQLVYQAGGISLPRDETVILREPPAEIADGWARTEAGLRRLREACEKSRTELLFVAIPSREEVEPGALERHADAAGAPLDAIDPVSPAQKALAQAAKLGLATLDPRPALTAAARDGTKLYFEKDWHVNPRGSRVLGRRIYEELCRPALLGGGTTPRGLAAFNCAPEEPSLPVWPFVVGALWIVLSSLYALSYRDEPRFVGFVGVAALIGAVVLIVWGFGELVELLGPEVGRYAGIGLVAALLGFILWKLLPKLSIIREVYASFLRRGLWYMIPLLVAMLSIGGLLVVASSSPFIAPFIYTLF